VVTGRFLLRLLPKPESTVNQYQSSKGVNRSARDSPLIRFLRSKDKLSSRPASSLSQPGSLVFFSTDLPAAS
jgi:hypothetical protein